MDFSHDTSETFVVGYVCGRCGESECVERIPGECPACGADLARAPHAVVSAVMRRGFVVEQRTAYRNALGGEL